METLAPLKSNSPLSIPSPALGNLHSTFCLYAFEDLLSRVSGMIDPVFFFLQVA